MVRSVIYLYRGVIATSEFIIVDRSDLVYREGIGNRDVAGWYW